MNRRLLLGAGLAALVVFLGSQIARPGKRPLSIGATPAPPLPARCRLDVNASPWAHHCQRLQRVCLDQSTIILWDSELQEVDGVAGALPSLVVSPNKVFSWPWLGQDAAGGSAKRGAVNSTAAAEGAAEDGQGRRRAYQVQVDYHRHLEPPRLRPATTQEPAPYLQAPAFSTCTVPVVLATTWRRNLWHVFDNAAVWYAMVRRTPWRQHLKPVVLTPDGLRLTAVESQLLPALAPMLALQSLAEFSARLPPGCGPGSQINNRASLGHRPQSFEGGEQRCFQNLFFCGTKIATGRAAPPSDTSLEAGVPRELFAWGQEVVRQQQQQQRQQNHAFQPTQQAQSMSQQPNAAKDGNRRLKILFMKRDSVGRQLLNAAELIERCNTWRLRRAGNQGTVTAECRQVTTSDLVAGVAAAQEASILLGMHGAGMANSWFMRPGSSTVEIMPYEWVSSQPGAMSLSGFNAADPTSKLLWWVLNICDASLSAPGPEERRQSGIKKWWPRDRSARLPWAALEALLAEVVAADGDQQRYLKEWYKTRRYRLDVGAEGVVGQGDGQR